MPHIQVFLLLFFFIFFSSKIAAWLIETKLHVEPLFDGGLKVCSWDLDHMIKMSTIPIYGEKLSKSSSEKIRK